MATSPISSNLPLRLTRFFTRTSTCAVSKSDNSKNFDIFESILEDDDEEWDEDEDVDYINDEDNLISFLNEYYVVYPKKIPKAEYK